MLNPTHSLTHSLDHCRLTAMKSRHQNVSILDFIGAKDEGDGGDNFIEAIRRAKLQSYRHQTYQHQLFAGRMPFLWPKQQCQRLL